jgi:hypothetical protein
MLVLQVLKMLMAAPMTMATMAMAECLPPVTSLLTARWPHSRSPPSVE